MGSKQQMFVLIMCLQLFVIAAFTDSNDHGALSAQMADWKNIPPSWSGIDPCGDKWEGIQCNNSRITSMVLSGMGLTGTLTADIGNLPELKKLDLSANKGLTGTLPSAIGKLKNLEYLSLADCSFFGQIPDTIGSLTKLSAFTITSNNFSGKLPPSIGNLINLYWLDVTNNKLTGTIPVSNGTSPGLDSLVNTKHFHCGQNMFEGEIPPELFKSDMTLIHLIFDSNRLVGSIPSTINSLQSLQVIKLDRNSLEGTVNFTGLTNMTQLYLSNNKLTGPMPDLSSMKLLTYVDMSNNSFDASSIPPWFLSLEYLTSLIMERTQLQGQIPGDLFNAAQLESIVLSNNQLNGTLDISTNFGNNIELIDLQNNNITKFTQGSGYNKKLMLQGNPICKSISSSEDYCNVPQQPTFTYSTQPNKCEPIVCSSNQICSPNCKCAYPITGTLRFHYVSFQDLGNNGTYTSFETSMIDAFKSQQLAVDSVAVSNPVRDMHNNLILRLQVFPSSNDRFNRTGFSMVTSRLNNIIPLLPLGTFLFILDNNQYFAERNKSSNTGIIIGAGVGSSILVLLLLMAIGYAFNQRRRARKAAQLRDPFASWDQDNNESNGSRPKITGVRCFSFKELQKCTNNFSDASLIGSGGYGKVYRGILTDRTLVAIKRSRKGSLQGSVQFKTEIELLSRVHHKNLVSLIGFCYEFDEQMLVYEYVSNGSLKDCISGKSGIRLSWERRLRIALDSARGLAYLHEHANPPIIHRDVKSTNILLDDQLVAKVADFGLSKPLGHSQSHVSENVKGTMGYLDPEYCVTQHATEKSDVYSFGVIMLELLTGRNPIDHGIYIVKVVRMAMDKTKDLYNFREILDPAIRFSSKLSGFEKFVDLAIMCVEELRANRPTMSEVAKEIENILKLTCLESDVEMVFTSISQDGSIQKSFDRPFTSKSFECSTGSFPDSGIQLQ